jgi:hypothetical protein
MIGSSELIFEQQQNPFILVDALAIIKWVCIPSTVSF